MSATTALVAETPVASPGILLAQVFEGSHSDAALWAKISGWDLSREKLYCANRLGYRDPAQLDRMELEYRKYLFLVCAHNSETLPISERVDDFWHAHVLHTRRYQAFWQGVLGRELHHNPTVSDDENLALWPAYEANTLRLYRRHFGEPPAEFWLDLSATGSCCTH